MRRFRWSCQSTPDGEPQPGAAFGLGVRAVDLVELLEDARLVLLRNAGLGVGHTEGEVAVAGGGGDAYLAGVRELDGVAHQVEQDLGEALLVKASTRSLQRGLLQGVLLISGAQ